MRAYGSCVISLSYCDISGNGMSPAVSVDERQDLTEAGSDAIIYIRRSVGDIISDPPSRKWTGKSSGDIMPSFNSVDQITINAIVGQAIEVINIIHWFKIFMLIIILAPGLLAW